MAKSITPEILRAPLEKVVLAAKMLNFNEPPMAILALAINPPDLKNIESTIWFLKEVRFSINQFCKYYFLMIYCSVAH